MEDIFKRLFSIARWQDMKFSYYLRSDLSLILDDQRIRGLPADEYVPRFRLGEHGHDVRIPFALSVIERTEPTWK